MAAGGKMVMVVGVDESDHSYHAVQWALRHFFPSGQPHRYRLVVVTAKPAFTPVEPGGPALLFQDPDESNKTAVRAIGKAKELCAAQQVNDAEFEVVEGDARDVLCDAVDRHNAEMLAVGSHAYGAFKRVVFGSVSDHCTHNAGCTVITVKKKPQDDPSSTYK